MSSSTTLPRRTTPKSLIGPYEVVGKPLGRGGMATVYRVQDSQGRQFAVKEFLPTLAADRDLARRFRLEFEILSELNHPNLVKVLELFEANGTLNIRMEHLDAMSLKDVMRATKPIPAMAAMAIAARVAGALAYAHDKGILHRDVKPDNILLTTKGKVKLADFGVARAGRGTGTRAGCVVGTPAYLGPEQLSGRLDLTASADLYSLGVVIYEMLEGKLPFPAGRAAGLVEMVNQRSTKPPRPAVRIADPQVKALVLACLSPDPNARPQKAGDIHDLLGALDGPRPEEEVAHVVQVSRSLSTRGATRRGQPAPAPEAPPEPRREAPQDRAERPARPVRAVEQKKNADDEYNTISELLTERITRGISALSTIVVGALICFVLFGWPFGASFAELVEWAWALAKALVARWQAPI